LQEGAEQLSSNQLLSFPWAKLVIVCYTMGLHASFLAFYLVQACIGVSGFYHLLVCVGPAIQGQVVNGLFATSQE